MEGAGTESAFARGGAGSFGNGAVEDAPFCASEERPGSGAVLGGGGVTEWCTPGGGGVTKVCTPGGRADSPSGRDGGVGGCTEVAATPFAVVTGAGTAGAFGAAGFEDPAAAGFEDVVGSPADSDSRRADGGGGLTDGAAMPPLLPVPAGATGIAVPGAAAPPFSFVDGAGVAAGAAAGVPPFSFVDGAGFPSRLGGRGSFSESDMAAFQEGRPWRAHRAPGYEPPCLLIVARIYDGKEVL